MPIERDAAESFECFPSQLQSWQYPTRLRVLHASTRQDVHVVNVAGDLEFKLARCCAARFDAHCLMLELLHDQPVEAPKHICTLASVRARHRMHNQRSFHPAVSARRETEQYSPSSYIIYIFT